MIYSSQDWLANANKQQALAVLTEELGHHFDGMLNSTDTPGYEGELFEALLHGDEVISAQKGERVKVENNQGSVLIQDEVLAVEKSRSRTNRRRRSTSSGRPLLVARSGGDGGRRPKSTESCGSRLDPLQQCNHKKRLLTYYINPNKLQIIKL